MPDAPDWYIYHPGSLRFIQTDMGELAVRIGSVCAYDRRGEVLWINSFENGIGGFSFTLDSSKSKVLIDSEVALWRGYSLKLDRISGDDTIIAYRPLPMPRIEKLGLEVSIYHRVLAREFIVGFLHVEEDTLKKSAIKFDCNINKIYYLNENNDYIEFQGIAYSSFKVDLWINIKLVWDYENNSYMRLLVGKDEVDLSNYSSYEVGGAGDDLFYTFISYSAASACSLNIGHMILTGNEPP